MGAARFAAVTAAKDLRRRLRDPAALLLWLGIPVLLGGLMSLAAGPGAAPRAHVLLVDLDESFLSRFLAGSGSASRDLPFEIEPVGLDEGRERIEAGEASALVVIPEGFAEGVLREEPVRIELVTNPSQRIAPAMVREALEMLVELAFYAHRLLGEELRELAAGPALGADFFENARVAAIAARVNGRVRSLEGTLFPPVLELELEGAEDEGAEDDAPGFGLLFLPGLLFMSLLFIGNGMSEDLWIEHESGTLRRALAGPRGLAPFLAGKTAAGAAVMAAAAALGLAVGLAFYGLPASRVAPAILWCAFCGLALFSLFVLLQLLASSRRGASLLALSVLFPLMMLGGSFFPFEALPGWMAGVGGSTPNGRGVLVLKRMLAGTLEPAELAAGAAVVALPGVVAFVLGLLLLRRRFAER